MGSGIDPEIPAKLLSCEKFAELSGTVGEISQLAVRLRKYAHRQTRRKARSISETRASFL
jgi:hypothetical protein